jgi:hypothetical protein
VGVVDSCLEFCRFEAGDILNTRRKFCNKESQNLYISGNVNEVFRSMRVGCALRSNKWVQNFDLNMSREGALGK